MILKKWVLLTIVTLGIVSLLRINTLTSVVVDEEKKTSTGFLFPNMGCTVIYASDGQIALGGNNEDYSNPFTMVWFLPPEEDTYGRVYFGYEGYLWQGGMNDQGLFFDAMAINEPVRVSRGEKPLYDGTLEDKAMAECATVDCVIELYSVYHTYDTWYHQFLFGDAEGNSVIIEPLTFLKNQDNYQIATNFYQSSSSSSHGEAYDRYQTAKNMFSSAPSYSIALLRDILNAVHSENGNPTLYSNIYDLKSKTIYLYFFHDFENEIIIQLEEELAKGPHAYYLVDLFPENQDYILWAQPKFDWYENLRNSYQVVELDLSLVEPYLGRYAVPEEMGLPYPAYEIAVEQGSLVLKIKPDKGWYGLQPISETSFFHVSSFSQFEVIFLPSNDGRVDQFIYTEYGKSHTFTRLSAATPTPTATQPPSLPTPTLSEPTTTSTELPTSTIERQTPTSTQTYTMPIPTGTQQAPASESSTGDEELPGWIYPVFGLVILLGISVWYLVGKKHQDEGSTDNSN
jgi:hypothetical protein